VCRTYGPTLLTACNQPGKANTLANAQPVTNTSRLNAAITALNTLEAQAKADYAGATWDAAWSQALDKVFGEVNAQIVVPIAEILSDPDISAHQALKTALRGFELNATQFLANGGSF
jgi:hypothetical protein